MAPIFNKKYLTEAINKAKNKNYLAYVGWENLTADIKNKDGLANGDFPALLLTLKGNLQSGQEINIGELQRTLAGKPKSDLSKILSTYPTVVNVKATVRPFWKSNFPTNSKSIQISLTEQK